jgi:hypothetical protein
LFATSFDDILLRPNGHGKVLLPRPFTIGLVSMVWCMLMCQPQENGFDS